MKKYFIVSDTHSKYKELIDVLKNNNFDFNNKEDILIILGDLFDRGTETVELFNFLIDLINKQKIILILGNHDYNLFNILKLKTYTMDNILNGTIFSLLELYNYLCNDDISIFEFYNNFNIYIEKLYSNYLIKQLESSFINYKIIKKYILVHSYIPLSVINKNKKIENIADNDWIKTFELNPFKLAKKHKFLDDYFIIAGHKICNNYLKESEEKEFYKYKNYININLEKLYCFILED